MNHRERKQARGFFITAAFVRLNGHFIDCDSHESYDHFTMLFDTDSFRFAELST